MLSSHSCSVDSKIMPLFVATGLGNEYTASMSNGANYMVLDAEGQKLDMNLKCSAYRYQIAMAPERKWACNDTRWL